MTARTAHTTHAAVDAAVQDLAHQLAGPAPRVVVYFASARYDRDALAAAMEAAFAPATVIGCTSAGEIATGAMLQRSIVAMALPPEVVGDVSVQVLHGLRGGADPVPAAFAAFEAHFGTPMRDLDPRRHVGLVLLDGLSQADERIMDSLGNGTDVPFVGGGAGDDLAFHATYVFANGKAHADAALLALLRVDQGYGVLKTQSFRVLAPRLTVTRVRAGTREVAEFDGRPAAEAYAAALGVSVAELEQRWASHPVGLMVDGEPFVRSPQRVLPDGSILFYCAMLEGMEVALLESTENLVSDTRTAVEAKLRELGGASAILNFNCILRRLELEQTGKADAYGKLFSSPTVGFSTYGEAYFGHMNQTATMLVLR